MVSQKRKRLFFIASRYIFPQHRLCSKELDEPTLSDVVTSMKGLNEAFALSEISGFTHWLRAYKNKIKGKGFGFDVVRPEMQATVTLTARYYKDALECCVVTDEKDWGFEENITTWTQVEEKILQMMKQIDQPLELSAKEILTQVGLSDTEIKKSITFTVLTPRESARCFGFPDWFSLSLSNNHAYFQFGNSILFQ